MRPMIAATPALPLAASPTAARDPEPVPVSTERLIRLVRECSRDLPQVRPDDVIAAAFQDVPVHASEDDLALLVAEAAAARVLEDPEYSQLAARLLAARIAQEVAGLGIARFSDAVALSHRVGLIADANAAFVARHGAALDRAIDDARTDRFGYFGLRTVYDRYLLRHPELRLVLETPQYFLLRVACGLSETPLRAARLGVPGGGSGPGLARRGVLTDAPAGRTLLRRRSRTSSGVVERAGLRPRPTVKEVVKA